MTDKKCEFGVAMRNFTAFPELPDAAGLIDYGVRMEALGYESLWVWDHTLLGVDPHFPILEAITLLTAVAARTERIKLGTGVLVLPLRNPVVLSKQLSSLDQISGGRFILGAAAGWYKREFDAVGIPFNRRGRLMDQNLEILLRLWGEDMVSGEYPPHQMRSSVMFPKSAQRPRPPVLIGGYVDAALERAATKGDGWLTYCYKPDSFARSWEKIRHFAERAGRDPDTLSATAQLPIVVGPRSKVEAPMREWLDTEWDFAGWSESTPDSAIIGPVDEVVEQLQAHIDVGAERIVFMPYRYQAEQLEILAKEVVPRLR